MKAFLLLPACGALLLAGCATPRMENDVTVFHDQIAPAGETIRVVPSDPAKIGNLEFKTYAGRIAEELRAAGYTPVSEPDIVTDLIAEVDYSVTAGTAEARTLGWPGMSVGVGYGRGRYVSPWQVGVFAPLIWGPAQTHTISVFQHSLELNIVDAAAPQQRVFEGRVVSAGSDGALNVVMPYLITALFVDFPGESGTTKIVEIELD